MTKGERAVNSKTSAEFSVYTWNCSIFPIKRHDFPKVEKYFSTTRRFIARWSSQKISSAIIMLICIFVELLFITCFFFLSCMCHILTWRASYLCDVGRIGNDSFSIFKHCTRICFEAVCISYQLRIVWTIFLNCTFLSYSQLTIYVYYYYFIFHSCICEWRSLKRSLRFTLQLDWSKYSWRFLWTLLDPNSRRALDWRKFLL